MHLDLRTGLGKGPVLVGLALVAAYVAAGRLGLLLAVPPGYATAIFPPAGIAMAASFIGSAAALPAVFLGSLVLNLWVGLGTHGRLDGTVAPVALVIAASSMVQAGLGGWCLRRLVGYPASLDHSRALAAFFLVTPLLCLICATLSLGGMAALGAVAQAEIWTSWIIWWVGDTFGVLLLLPVMMVAVGEPRALWRDRAVSVALPLLLFFALFVGIFVRVSGWEKEQSLLEFRMLCQELLDKLQAQLGSQEDSLEQLNHSFVAPARLSRGDFRALSHGVLRGFPAIQSAEWAPRVTADRRAEFEAAERQVFPDFAIRERDGAGRLRPAAKRGEFYPVSYVEPLVGNAPAIGFDLASEADRREPIDWSFATGSVAVTRPIRLVQEIGDEISMLLVSAVQSGENGPGVLVAALRMGNFMLALLGPAAASMNVELVDVELGQRLFSSLPGSAARPAYEESFVFGSRRFAFRAAPSAFYLAQHPWWESLGVLMAGALSTSLLGAVLLLGTGERHRFATLLAERTRERDRIWQVSEDLLGVGDFAGYFYSINPAWTRALGWSAEEIGCMHVSELRHPDDAPAALAKRKRLADHGGTVRMENRFRHNDGSWRWIYWTLTAEQGAIYVIGRNVTADKERAAQLALAEAQLRQSQKMESVGQLTGGIAHDFNNLLTAILGNIELARDRVADARTRTLLTNASHSAERGAKLVEQLLAFSRNQHLQPRPVGLNQLVAGIRHMLNRSLGANIRISESLSPDLWPAMADPNQVELVILNLAINGRDAMPTGGQLLIATRNSPAADGDRPAELAQGDYVAIAVTDTGTGMTETVMAKALEPFFTTKEPGKGSGLGLSMVHGVATQSGGTVTLSSRLGHGTTVTVYLPRAEADAAAGPPERQPKEAAEESPLGALVLLVDDDAEVRQATAGQLAELGCRVIAVESGATALAALAAAPKIDIALIDFAMPGMNGLDAADRLVAARPELRVVMITGYADTAAIKSHPRRYPLLTKPFWRAELAAAMIAAWAAEAAEPAAER